MIKPDDETYLDREQSAVKQYILREYLLPFALIIGTFKDIAYVDCCAGPWQSRSKDYGDTSFGIAVHALREARSELSKHGHRPEISCLFIEHDIKSFEKLKAFCSQISDLHAVPLQGDFTQKVAEIKRFLAQHSNPFPFFFVDPKGWKPIRIAAIEPILQISPGEVLINFMTSHIRRFLSLEGLDFGALLGKNKLAEVANLHGAERDEAAVFAYASEVMRAGGYGYISTTVVPNPLKAQAHFHLIYGTRSWKGIEKFKEAEKRAFGFAGRIRKRAQRREREERTKQPELVFVEEEADSNEVYLDRLRSRFLQLAQQRIRDEIDSGRKITYGSLAALFLRRPLVWESDLRSMLSQMVKAEIIDIEGATPTLRNISTGTKITKL